MCYTNILFTECILYFLIVSLYTFKEHEYAFAVHYVPQFWGKAGYQESLKNKLNHSSVYMYDAGCCVLLKEAL